MTRFSKIQNGASTRTPPSRENCSRTAPKAGARTTIGSFGLPGRVTSILTPERSEEHTSELQSLMRTSYAEFCLKNSIHPQTTVNRQMTELITATRTKATRDSYQPL